jgi:hypothetical protein
MWWCRCACDGSVIRKIAAGELKKMANRPVANGPWCACRRPVASRTKHGQSRSALYAVWSAMKDRCYNPSNKRYRHYGGRGILVCQGWRESYKEFLADMSPRPNGAELDRIDNDRGYDCGRCPDCRSRLAPVNVRWATRVTNQRNKRTSRMIECGGRTMTMANWAEEKGMDYSVLQTRLDVLGWDVALALEMPALATGQKRASARYGYGGRLLTLAEIARAKGWPDSLIRQRLKRNWTFDEAVSTPPGRPRPGSDADTIHRREE